jgi:hypothetical protein
MWFSAQIKIQTIKKSNCDNNEKHREEEEGKEKQGLIFTKGFAHGLHTFRKF